MVQIRFVLNRIALVNKKPIFVLGAFAATVLNANAALVWQAGQDDGGWPLTGSAGGPDANFVQENGVINAIPGSPNSTPVPQGADNDYYFAGTYTTALPGNVSTYGSYAPIGVVAAHENSAERAFAGGDLDLRYHFNLPAGMSPNDLLTFTYEPLNLDDLNATNFDPRFGAEVYVNGVLVMSQKITRPADLSIAVTTPQFSLASVGAVTGPGADNIVSLRGISYNGAPGGGNWMGIDYVRLDVTPVPEPGSSAMVLLGAMGCVGLLGRRRR
jgi:hypothetical protein